MPYTKEYYESHREEILEKNKIYREQNKDKMKKKSKEYYEENKDELRENHRIWSKEKFHCECGAVIRRDRKNEHLKLSRKHNPEPIA